MVKAINKETAEMIRLVLSGDYKLNDDGYGNHLLVPSRKLIRAMKREERQILDTQIKAVIVSYIKKVDQYAKEGKVLNSYNQPVETAYYSVKPTTSSFGLLPEVINAEVKATRDDVLRVLNQMVKNDELERVAVKGGVEICLTEANNFQIRYRSIKYAVVPQTDAPMQITTNACK